MTRARGQDRTVPARTVFIQRRLKLVRLQGADLSQRTRVSSSKTESTVGTESPDVASVVRYHPELLTNGEPRAHHYRANRTVAGRKTAQQSLGVRCLTSKSIASSRI